MISHIPSPLIPCFWDRMVWPQSFLFPKGFYNINESSLLILLCLLLDSCLVGHCFCLSIMIAMWIVGCLVADFSLVLLGLLWVTSNGWFHLGRKKWEVGREKGWCLCVLITDALWWRRKEMDLWESWCCKFAKSGFFSPGSKRALSFTTRDTTSFICKYLNPSPFLAFSGWFTRNILQSGSRKVEQCFRNPLSASC